MDFVSESPKRPEKDTQELVEEVYGLIVRLFEKRFQTKNDKELDNAQIKARQEGILTEVLPAIMLDLVSNWGVGDLYRDLDTVVIAAQAMAMEQAEWEDDEDVPIGLGCNWRHEL